MNNAQEYYQYCLDHKYGTGSSKRSSIKHIEVLLGALQPGEKILICFIGMRLTGESGSIGYCAFAFTNKRFITARKKLIGRVLQSVDVANINDITAVTGILTTRICIDSIKEKIDIQMSRDTKIYDDLNAIFLQLKTANKQHAKLSDSEEILKYKKLMDDGVITKQEFGAKKKMILGI